MALSKKCPLDLGSRLTSIGFKALSAYLSISTRSSYVNGSGNSVVEDIFSNRGLYPFK